MKTGHKLFKLLSKVIVIGSTVFILLSDWLLCLSVESPESTGSCCSSRLALVPVGCSSQSLQMSLCAHLTLCFCSAFRCTGERRRSVSQNSMLLQRQHSEKDKLDVENSNTNEWEC